MKICGFLNSAATKTYSFPQGFPIKGWDYDSQYREFRPWHRWVVFVTMAWLSKKDHWKHWLSPMRGWGCAACSTPLYSFQGKMKSGCGWAAFSRSLAFCLFLWLFICLAIYLSLSAAIYLFFASYWFVCVCWFRFLILMWHIIHQLGKARGVAILKLWIIIFSNARASVFKNLWGVGHSNQMWRTDSQWPRTNQNKQNASVSGNWW